MAAIYAAVRCAVIGYAGGQQVVNVFNIAGTGGAQEAAGVIGTAYGEHFATMLASQYTFDSVHAIDMSSVDGDTYTFSMGAYGTATGGSAGEIGTSALLKWTDSVTGRAFRPTRSFLGPISRTRVNDLALELLPSDRTAIQAAAQAFLTQVNLGGALVAVHGLGTPNQQLAPITAVNVPLATGHLDSRRR